MRTPLGTIELEGARRQPCLPVAGSQPQPLAQGPSTPLVTGKRPQILWSDLWITFAKPSPGQCRRDPGQLGWFFTSHEKKAKKTSQAIVLT